MTRAPEPVERGAIYQYDHKVEDLLRAIRAIFDRSERLAPPDTAAFSEIVRREPYPVNQKADEILDRLRQFGITRFLLLFRGSRSRSEVVATFLAVLELCRERVIRLAGSDVDCTVGYEQDVPETTAT
jgi:segregation and condensation protein A